MSWETKGRIRLINKNKDLEKSNNLNNTCKANICKPRGEGITFQRIRGHNNRNWVLV